MNDRLRHYGIPGMKWGVRKARKKAERNFNNARMKKRILDDISKNGRDSKYMRNEIEHLKRAALIQEGRILTEKQISEAETMTVKNLKVAYRSYIKRGEIWAKTAQKLNDGNFTRIEAFLIMDTAKRTE